MGSHFGNAGVFLVETLFGLYITVLMLRILLQLVRANFFNPICQFIVKVTNPVLAPMRRVLPNWRNLDVPATVFMVMLKCIELTIILSIVGRQLSVPAVVAVALVSLLDFAILTLLVVIFIKIVISWIAPYSDSPINPLLYELSAPLLEPARRAVPPISGLDLSPMIVLIGLQLSRILLVGELMDLTRHL
jgi:YggT family protein